MGVSRGSSADQRLDQALGDLAASLDTHRLTFLYFVTARRILDRSRLSNNAGNLETVTKAEMPGYSEMAEDEDIDTEGKFLHRHRNFLNRFADKALSRFGFRRGRRAEGEEGSLPYWVLDDETAHYLEDTSTCVLQSVKAVRQLDDHNACQALMERAASAIRDHRNTRWTSSTVTRWEYLAELDEVIADVKGLEALGVRLDAGHQRTVTDSTVDSDSSAQEGHTNKVESLVPFKEGEDSVFSPSTFDVSNQRVPGEESESAILSSRDSDVEDSSKIPSEHRTRVLTKREAAKFLGKPNPSSGVKWLNQCIKDGAIHCESFNRQSFVFDIREFPGSERAKLRPSR